MSSLPEAPVFSAPISFGPWWKKGYTVRAIRRHDKLPFYIPASVWEKVEWIPGDILDIVGLEEAMEGMDAVIHAAAKVSFAGRDRRELFQTNIEGTANVVNAALSNNVRRFIHVSSVAALGRTANGETVTEDKKWEDSKLNTNYAISKFHGVVEVWRGDRGRIAGPHRESRHSPGLWGLAYIELRTLPERLQGISLVYQWREWIRKRHRCCRGRPRPAGKPAQRTTVHPDRRQLVLPATLRRHRDGIRQTAAYPGGNSIPRTDSLAPGKSKIDLFRPFPAADPGKRPDRTEQYFI